MPSARASRRGAFLNCRFEVNGIQKALCSRSVVKSARLFMRLAYSSGALRQCTKWQMRLGRVGHDALFLLTEPGNCETHHISGPEELGSGFDAHADARWRAGGN